MKKLCVSLIVMSALVVASVAQADKAPAQPVKKKASSASREDLDIVKGFRKGGRGLVNVATSPFEIPNQMVLEAKKHKTVGGAIGGYFAGLPIGCGWMAYRLGVGIFDFVTFPIPTPTYDTSHIEPAYLLPGDPYIHQ